MSAADDRALLARAIGDAWDAAAHQDIRTDWRALAVDAVAPIVEDLTRWKSEAMDILGDWDQVWEALGSPGRLGESKAKSSRATVDAVVEMLHRQRVQHKVLIAPRHPHAPVLIEVDRILALIDGADR